MFVVLEVLGIGALAAKGASGEFVKRLFLEPCRTLWEDLADDDRDGVLVCACGLALPGTMTLRLTAAFRLPGFGSVNGRTRKLVIRLRKPDEKSGASKAANMTLKEMESDTSRVSLAFDPKAIVHDI